MKVLMLGWELPPNNSGGLGVACFQLCKALSANQINIDFILPYKISEKPDFMKVHSSYVNDASTSVNPPEPVSAYESLENSTSDFTKKRDNLCTSLSHYEETVERIIESKTFDIIHAHDWLTFRAAIMAKQKTGNSMILHIHSIEADRAGGAGKGNPFIREIEQMSLLTADKIIAVSNHTKQAIIREYSIPSKDIDVVHNSVDKTWYRPLDERSAFSYLVAMKSRGYKVVVNVGRITIQKGLYNLLLAAQEVVKRRPKTLFLLIGNGEQQLELIELAASLGISKNVIFGGFQRGKNLRDAFAIGDLFVMPSVSEPFGIAPLEAIGYGTPVLISKQSGVAEVLRSCLKVDYWDVNELANQIFSAINYDALLNELHDNASKEYIDLSWDNAAKKISYLYEGCSNRKTVTA